MVGWRGGRFGLGGFLLARLNRQVMPYGATGKGSEHRMMMREMPGHGSDGSALQASGLGWRSSGRGNQESGKHSGKSTRHWVLRLLYSGP